MHTRLYFWICCSHPCFSENSNSKDLVGMDPKMLAIILFYFERETLEERFFYCSPFFRKAPTRLS
jgi:hypothetical protein